jgi:hypothetical protein
LFIENDLDPVSSNDCVFSSSQSSDDSLTLTHRTASNRFQKRTPVHDLEESSDSDLSLIPLDAGSMLDSARPTDFSTLFTTEPEETAVKVSGPSFQHKETLPCSKSNISISVRVQLGSSLGSPIVVIPLGMGFERKPVSWLLDTIKTLSDCKGRVRTTFPYNTSPLLSFRWCV